jgi:hypothetical protein
VDASSWLELAGDRAAGHACDAGDTRDAHAIHGPSGASARRNFSRWIRLSRLIRATIGTQNRRQSRIHRINFHVIEYDVD